MNINTMQKRKWRFSAVILISLLLILLSGCACFEKDNRRLLNQVDKTFQPQSTAGKIAVAPLMIPAGTVCLALDMVVINPACQIPKAADDTYRLYWKPREMSMFRRSLFFIPCVILTPPTFVVDELGRCLFPIN